jgi:hypothetical protein
VAAGVELPTAQALEGGFRSEPWKLETMEAYSHRRSASGFRHGASGMFIDQGAHSFRWTAETLGGRRGNRIAVIAGRTGAKHKTFSPRDAFPVSVAVLNYDA